jgi:hypothetical protein
MKVRSGFVSNSSSSSFILPFKSDNDKVTLEFSISDIRDMLDRSGLSEVYILQTEDDVKKYIVGRYGWGNKTFEDLISDIDDTWIADNYNKIMSDINDGKFIMTGSIDNGEYLANLLIKQLGGEVDD